MTTPTPLRPGVRACFVALLGVLALAACSGTTHEGGDARQPEVSADAPAADAAPPDARADLPRGDTADAVADAAVDLPSTLDVGPESPADLPADPGAEAEPSDALVDPGAEPPADGVADPGAEAGPDASPDVPADVPADQAPDAGPDACATCAAYGPVAVTGTVAVPALLELSGLGASRLHPGVVYAHADSGDSARFFAFDLDGAPRGEFHLAPDVAAVDWEDLSMGPCDTGSCLYVGDIGDNLAERAGYVVYVVPEPTVLDAAEPLAVPYAALPFRYPDGPHNSETLLVHPQTGDVYVVVKSMAAWDVYKLPAPHTPGVEVVLLKVGTVPSPGFGALSTGGDIHPCGTRVLLRSYGKLVELRLGAGQAFDTIFGVAGVTVPVANEPQGEAVAYDLDGLGYLTVSEGVAAEIHHVACE